MTKRRDPSTGRFVKEQSLTAAASAVPTKALDRLPRAAEAWQGRAWRLWRLLGVVHFPTTFKAKQVGRLAWNVEINGEMLEAEEAAAALEAITQPLGTAEVARRIALNLEVAGEVWYMRAGDEWSVYSPTKTKLKELQQAADIRVRGLDPDPEEPDKPTSSIQAALGTAEAIRLMAQMSRGQDRNRLAQRGILLVPTESKFPEGDDFQANLEEAMTAPIADEYAPSSVVPLKVTTAAEYIKEWRHLLLESPYDDKLMERIDATVKQFAREIDMPVEVLLGNIDSNHWNAWISDDQNYSGHIEPLGVLTGQVLAVAMTEVAGDRFAGATIKVTPDPTGVLTKRLSFEDSLRALEMGVVGFEFVRRAAGADEDDAPTDEEIERILLLKGLAPQPIPSEEEDREAPEMPDELPEPPQAVAASVSDEDEALDDLGDALADIDQNLLLRLQGAADMLTDQVRARVDADQVGMPEAIAAEVNRLSTAWGRMAAEGRQGLRRLGIDTEGPEWEVAQEHSVAVLSEGMTAWLTETIARTDSEMPELPTDLLRQVLAAAGGSSTATVAALTAPRGILAPPTPADPQAFASGVLTSKQLKAQGLVFKQWRWRYGSAPRSHPFHWHKQQDGRFTDADGTVGGWYVGDHKGDLCQYAPVWRKGSAPEEVA